MLQWQEWLGLSGFVLMFVGVLLAQPGQGKEPRKFGVALVLVGIGVAAVALLLKCFY